MVRAQAGSGVGPDEVRVGARVLRLRRCLPDESEQITTTRTTAAH